MTAATLTHNIETHNAHKEVVVLTASDTNTFISKKFSVVEAVQGTIMEDTTTLSLPLSLDVSGATVTINCTGLSSDKICLTLYGRK